MLCEVRLYRILLMHTLSKNNKHHVELNIADQKWVLLDEFDELARRSINMTLECFDTEFPSSETHILATNDTQMARLNGQYRNTNVTTNVLSWPVNQSTYPDHPEGNTSWKFLGDIAVAFDFCQNEAKLKGVRFDHHITHLLVHGCLHLLGFDHIDDADARQMEQLEIKILTKLGINNPY